MAYAIDTLKALPFGQIIGGPMRAAIEAQAAAANATVEFIKKVGFKPPDEDNFFEDAADPDLGDVRYVKFNYTYQEQDGTQSNATLEVPILTIVPIPFIRIDEMTIDFTAKITETMTQASESADISSYSSDLSVKAGFKWWWASVSVGFKSSYSSTHSSTAKSSSRFQSEMTMNVHIRAVQDDMPGGLSRVLDILESAIQSGRPDEAIPETSSSSL